MRHLLASLFCLAAFGLAPAVLLAADGTNLALPVAALRAAIEAGCAAPTAKLAVMAERIGSGARGITQEVIRMTEGDAGWRRSFALPAQGLLELTRFAPAGELHHINAEFAALIDDTLRPTLTVIAGPDCEIVEARRLIYDAEGRPVEIDVLDNALELTRSSELLNPPLPDRPPRDTLAQGSGETVTVAVVDSGVNYLLPEIADALARDGEGRALGYDFWELDARPFDADTTRSPYFPTRRGTRVASLVLREAPGARLIPYRFPHPDPRRMVDLLADARAKNVDIVLVSAGTSSVNGWRAFARAAAMTPETLLVVAAGEGGRDLDREPYYPATLALGNMIVVTSANGAGEPASGANWGAGTVHLMVPGENIEVIDFDGTLVRGAGPHLAAARITALGVRLKRAHPDWHADELMAAIFAKARPPKGGGLARVSHGLIEDPLAD